MSERIRKSSTSKTSDQEETQRSSAASTVERGEDFHQAVDDLLQEIDDVLEKNAEEFVAGYIQRGGE